LIKLDYNLIATVATTVLIVASVTLGAKYQKLKGKVEKLRDLVDALVKAWEDDTITEAEVEALVGQAKALLEPEEE